MAIEDGMSREEVDRIFEWESGDPDRRNKVIEDYIESPEFTRDIQEASTLAAEGGPHDLIELATRSAHIRAAAIVARRELGDLPETD